MTVDINKFEEICNNGQIALILTDLEDAANKGNFRCQELLSDAFLMGCYGGQVDFNKGFIYTKMAAENGNVPCMNNLSVCYINGNGTPQNEKASYEWMQKAAEYGYVLAFFPLAYKWMWGIGVEGNFDQAEYWARRALDEGGHVEDARMLLSQLHQFRSGMVLNEQPNDGGQTEFEHALEFYNQGNHKTAFHYFVASAYKGHAVAMNNASVFCMNGEGTEKNEAEAFYWMKKSAESGYIPAFYVLAVKYHCGIGVDMDAYAAEYWGERALAEDEQNKENIQKLLEAVREVKQYLDLPGNWENGAAEFTYGSRYKNENNIGKYLEYMHLSAEKGYVLAMHNLANAYKNGEGTEKNLELAKFWAQKASDAGMDDILNDINQALNEQQNQQDNGDEEFRKAWDLHNSENYSEAMKWYLLSAEKGNATAMNNISVAYAFGNGVEVDCKKAFEWMKKAAENGHVPAYYTLAVKYAQGSGTERNFEEAENWANRIPQNDQNYKKAQDLLKHVKNIRNFEMHCPEELTPGEIFDAGVGYYSEKANDQAFSCFLKAAQLGHNVAMNNLSSFYMNGWGTDVDKEAAFEWMKKAAEGGWKQSYYPLAVKYYNGTGVEKNLEQAEFWGRKALEVKDANTQNAQKLLNLIEKAKQQTAQKQSQNVNVSKNYPSQVQADFERGRDLYKQQNYTESLEYLEKAAKEGHVEALVYIGEAYYYGRGLTQNIGHAYKFLEAAALRGSRTAQSYIASGIIGSNYAFLWKAYAKDQGFKNAHEEYIKEITKVRNDTTAWVHPFDASEAMVNAAECWKNYLRNPHPSGRITLGGDPGRGQYASQFFFIKALKYGNLDGACGYSLYLQGLKDKTYLKQANEHYRLAAYFGHSYAMLRMGQYYDDIDRKAANACYQQAARWKYSPAIRVCQERGLDY